MADGATTRQLGFGIGAHTPERVRALVCGGQQPYSWPDSPLTRVVTNGLGECQGRRLALVEAFERFWQVRFPEAQRARWIDNDPKALQAMWTKLFAEGPVATALSEWTGPCVIVLGAGDGAPSSLSVAEAPKAVQGRADSGFRGWSTTRAAARKLSRVSDL